MPRLIAFLRAINVGGRTVKMEALKTIIESMGLDGVETFIASGNVIFENPGVDAASLEKRIEAGLRNALGYEVNTFIRTPAEVTAISTFDPFPDLEQPESSALYVTFLGAAPDEVSRQRVEEISTRSDVFQINARELYWLRMDRSIQMQIPGQLLEKAVGMPGTMRNITTIKRLAEKYPPV